MLGNKAIHIYNGNPGLHQATPNTCCECDQLTLQCHNCQLDVHAGCVIINYVELETFEMLDIPFIYPKYEWNEMEMPFLDSSMSLGDDMVIDPDTIVDDVTMEISRPEGKGLLTACLNVNGLDVRGRMDELKLLLVQQPFDFIAINETKLDNS